jgi:hypothetical protein
MTIKDNPVRFPAYKTISLEPPAPPPTGRGGPPRSRDEATLSLEISWRDTPSASEFAGMLLSIQLIADLATARKGIPSTPVHIEIVTHPNMALKIGQHGRMSRFNV